MIQQQRKRFCKNGTNRSVPLLTKKSTKACLTFPKNIFIIPTTIPRTPEVKVKPFVRCLSGYIKLAQYVLDCFTASDPGRLAVSDGKMIFIFLSISRHQIVTQGKRTEMDSDPTHTSKLNGTTSVLLRLY